MPSSFRSRRSHSGLYGVFYLYLSLFFFFLFCFARDTLLLTLFRFCVCFMCACMCAYRYKSSTKQDYTAETDPGVLSVTQIWLLIHCTTTHNREVLRSPAARLRLWPAAITSPLGPSSWRLQNVCVSHCTQVISASLRCCVVLPICVCVCVCRRMLCCRRLSLETAHAAAIEKSASTRKLSVRCLLLVACCAVPCLRVRVLLPKVLYLTVYVCMYVCRSWMMNEDAMATEKLAGVFGTLRRTTPSCRIWSSVCKYAMLKYERRSECFEVLRC